MTNSENILEASDNELLSVMSKELLKLTKKKTTTPTNNRRILTNSQKKGQ